MTVPARIEYNVVREPSFEHVQDDVVLVLNSTRPRTTDAKRFQWLYNHNPEGHATIWSLRRSDTNEMVGFTACLPRRMIVNGSEKRAWIGSDFSILPRYRTLGLAVRLRRAARDAIDGGAVDMLFAHPNDRMALIHNRAGHLQVGTMERYARLLSCGPTVRERVRNRLLAAPVEVLCDLLLRLSDPEKRRRRRHTVKQESTTVFDDRFDRLFEEYCPPNIVMGSRDSRYLAWRYGENPLYESHVLTAYDKGQLAGYLIWTVKDDFIWVRDLFPATKSVACDLLREVTRLGRKQKLRSATLTLSSQHPLEKIFMELGYRPRSELSQVYAYISPDQAPEDRIVAPERWHFTVGDRDV